MQLTEDMQRVVIEQRLGFVATVTADGRPNLSPKGTTTVFDDEHLVFADVASPGTVENLRVNPHVEVNVVDPFVRKGYRFKGTATVHVDDDTFEEGMRALARNGYTTARDRVRHIVVIKVEEAASLISPAYSGATTEADIVATWVDHYVSVVGSRHTIRMPTTEPPPGAGVSSRSASSPPSAR